LRPRASRSGKPKNKGYLALGGREKGTPKRCPVLGGEIRNEKTGDKGE